MTWYDSGDAGGDAGGDAEKYAGKWVKKEEERTTIEG